MNRVSESQPSLNDFILLINASSNTTETNLHDFYKFQHHEASVPKFRVYNGGSIPGDFVIKFISSSVSVFFSDYFVLKKQAS